jgi:hypothetical protein
MNTETYGQVNRDLCGVVRLLLLPREMSADAHGGCGRYMLILSLWYWFPSEVK